MKNEKGQHCNLEATAEESVPLPSAAVVPTRQGSYKGHIAQGQLWSGWQDKQIGGEKRDNRQRSWGRPLAKKIGDTFERNIFVSIEVRSGGA